MSNYIGNAIKFAPLESHIYITTKNLGERVQFSVKDEGPGISKEDQKLLFGEFQTLSAQPTGGEKSTGLGLAIVKKLVTLHGGDVGVISEIGQGATFIFTLPAGRESTRRFLPTFLRVMGFLEARFLPDPSLSINHLEQISAILQA